MIEKRPHLGIALNLGSVAIMSLAPILSRFSLDTVSPALAGFLNTAFAFCATLLWGRFVGAKLWPHVKDRLLWAIGCANATGTLLLYMSILQLGPIPTAFIGRFYVVFALILGMILLKERIRRAEYVLAAVAVAGVFTFSSARLDGLTQSLYVFAALGYTFCFALTNALAKRAIPTRDPIVVLFSTSLAALPVLAAFTAVEAVVGDLRLGASGVGFVAAAALTGSFFGLLLFYHGLRHIAFSHANLIRTIQPVTVAAVAWPFFPVEVTWPRVLGAVLIVGSVCILSWMHARNSKVPEVKE